ncbi:fluoride efflux transporter FluC [Antribacter gilvus]|uniref:fluoride efflux transporter FluC n=1 Tax=Antribacter gilvus TaxID=2304675 RepID=UPI000F79EAA0|nr:CrcB family protein [Antribacter gilvus]
MSALLLALVAAGGGLGAAARFVLDGEVRSRARAGFPWGTFTVNVVGSLVIGVVTGVLLGPGLADGVVEPWRAAVATGLCGGFTTFSTATVEAVRLAQSGRLRLAVASVLGTLLVTVLAVGVGIAVGTLF